MFGAFLTTFYLSFFQIQYLVVLNLAGNRITTIDEAAFCCLPNLLNLDLSNNPLKGFNPSTFNGVRNHLQVKPKHIRFYNPLQGFIELLKWLIKMLCYVIDTTIGAYTSLNDIFNFRFLIWPIHPRRYCLHFNYQD